MMVTTTLLKALTQAGLGSRRAMADAVMRGRVAVNGETAESLKHPVDVDKDSVTLDGRAVELSPSRLIYIMLNKPAGVVTSVGDQRGRQTVMDLLPQGYRSVRLHPVGRLDRDTTGLLLLTNDGAFTYHITHPSFEREKEYLARIESRLSAEEIRSLEQGVELGDGVTHQAAVREVEHAPPFSYSVIIHEGRKRQVRRMFAALGHSVVSLHRTRIGNLRLGALAEGEVRELGADEVRRLIDS
jgi:23S rRNA pseudouridine2605 synthase